MPDSLQPSIPSRRIRRALPVRNILAFGVVGTLGFTADGGILTLLSQHFGFDLFSSRAVSFTVATVITWLLNRTLVFAVCDDRPRNKRGEYARYLIVQVCGALLNLSIFSIAIAAHPPFRTIPIIPLAIGAVFGLAFNYSGSRIWVFR